MAEFIKVADIGDLTEGTMKKVIINGRDILLAMSGGRYYAADNRCPHMHGDLSAGKLEGTVVDCPRHHSQFDLTDGHIVRWTDLTGVKLALSKAVKVPQPLRTYEVKIEGNDILVAAGEIPASV